MKVKKKKREMEMMSPEKGNNKKGKLFQNPFLEKLTRTKVCYSFAIFFGSYAGVVIYNVYYYLLNPELMLLFFLGGMFFGTFFEYMMHRFLFHIPPYNSFWKRFQYTVHGVHHDYPRDTFMVAMPPLVSMV